MEVIYGNLSRTTEPTLTVSADKAKARGGVDSVLIRPKTADPVAVTAITFGPLA
jgi:hypothetical protein